MAGKNRHLYGDTKPILVQCPGAVSCEAGDFIYKEENVLNQAYPFDECRAATAGTANMEHIHTNFLGISMENSDSGVTEYITIATAGVFRMPLIHASAVTVGASMSAVSSVNRATYGVSPHHVANYGDGYATTAYLGICMKTESGASYVDFELVTMLGSGTSLQY